MSENRLISHHKRIAGSKHLQEVPGLKSTPPTMHLASQSRMMRETTNLVTRAPMLNRQCENTSHKVTIKQN